MFEYFPGNYVWNLGGGRRAEQRRPDRRGRPGLPADPRRRPRSGEDAGTGDFLRGLDRRSPTSSVEQAEAALSGRARPDRGRAVLPRDQLPVQRRADAGARPHPSRVPRSTGGCSTWPQKAFELRDPLGQPGGGPVPGHHSARPTSAQAPAAGVRPGAGDHHVERAGLHQGAHVHLLALGRAGRPRHLLPDGRLPGLRRGAATAGTRPRGSTPRRGRRRASTTWSPAPTSTRPGSGWSAGRSAATTRPGRPRSRSGWRWSSPGARTTTGARCSGAGWSARVSGRCRTTGSTCCGCGDTPDTDTFIDFADQVHLDGVVSQITVPFLDLPRRERPADPA